MKLLILFIIFSLMLLTALCNLELIYMVASRVAFRPQH